MCAGIQGDHSKAQQVLGGHILLVVCSVGHLQNSFRSSFCGHWWVWYRHSFL